MGNSVAYNTIEFAKIYENHRINLTECLDHPSLSPTPYIKEFWLFNFLLHVLV